MRNGEIAEAFEELASLYELDGAVLSLRSALDVYPELDRLNGRNPPTEWYYTRVAKDETLPQESSSMVWACALRRRP